MKKIANNTTLASLDEMAALLMPRLTKLVSGYL